MNSLPSPTDVVHRYVDNHNAGVKGIGWEGLGALFDDDALLEFDGIPMGPVQGARAIVEIYRAHPPSEPLELIEVQETPDGATASYSWSSSPTVFAGTLSFSIINGLIQRLVIQAVS